MIQRDGEAVVSNAGTTSDRAFLLTCAVLFVTTGLAAVWSCGTMEGDMPMPGGWTMSMAWMRMPGQTWPGAAAMFMAMWVLMMIPMMLPSLVGMLTRWRAAVGETHDLDRTTAIAGAGYFAIWTAFGAAVYPLGVAISAAAMRWSVVSRAVPLATGIVVVLAGCLQLSEWKVRQLRRCRDGACVVGPTRGAAAGWRHGLGLGADCVRCCFTWMAILLAGGVMDVGVMALVATAITVERYASRPARAARMVGTVALAAGMVMAARALWMG